MQKIRDFLHVKIADLAAINPDFYLLVSELGAHISCLLLSADGSFNEIRTRSGKLGLNPGQGARDRLGAGEMTPFAQPVPEKMPPGIFARVAYILVLREVHVRIEKARLADTHEQFVEFAVFFF